MENKKTKMTLASAPWCLPCRSVKKLIADLGLDVEVKCAEEEADKEFFAKHNIRSVPRLIIEDGDEVRTINGSEDIIKELTK